MKQLWEDFKAFIMRGNVLEDFKAFVIGNGVQGSPSTSSSVPRSAHADHRRSSTSASPLIAFKEANSG